MTTNNEGCLVHIVGTPLIFKTDTTVQYTAGDIFYDRALGPLKIERKSVDGSHMFCTAAYSEAYFCEKCLDPPKKDS